MAVIDHIDGPNRDIYLHLDTMNTEVRPVDIYKEMRTLRRTDETLRKYDLFLKAEGYVPKGGGTFTPILVTCLLGTRIIPYDGTHVLTITGEIITDEGTSGVACFDRSGLTPGVEVDINYVPPQVEVIEIISGSGVTEQDKLDIADRVWDEVLSGPGHLVVDSAATALRSATYLIGSITLDIVKGTAGTGWPIGTHYKPSNNLTDTLTIMGYGNVHDLVLESDVNIEAAHDISNLIVRTFGRMGIDVVLLAGCVSDNTTFKNVNLSGVITAGHQILVYDCSIGNITNFRGIMNNVSFAQGSEVILDTWANIIQGTAGGEPTNEVEINIGAASLNMSHWTGNLKLKGKTGTDRTVINCDSGNIIIDATCVAGTIQLIGSGQIEADNSGPGCNVDIDGFLNIETTAAAVWDKDISEHVSAGSTGEKLNDTPTDVENADAVWNKTLP